MIRGDMVVIGPKGERILRCIWATAFAVLGLGELYFTAAGGQTTIGVLDLGDKVFWPGIGGYIFLVIRCIVCGGVAAAALVRLKEPRAAVDITLPLLILMIWTSPNPSRLAQGPSELRVHCLIVVGMAAALSFVKWAMQGVLGDATPCHRGP